MLRINANISRVNPHHLMLGASADVRTAADCQCVYVLSKLVGVTGHLTSKFTATNYVVMANTTQHKPAAANQQKLHSRSAG